MRAASRALFSSVTLAMMAVVMSPACSQGEGDGSIQGTLNVPNCWTGGFDLNPNFFAAVPYRNEMTYRIQNGSDFQSFSDGLTILLTDITKVRPDPTTGFAGAYRQPLRVDLPNAVTPPGVPVEPDPNPALVNMTLYLQKSCSTQVVALQAVDQVALPNDGTCTVQAQPGADPSQGCAPDKDAPAGVGTGKSLIAFTSVANGKLDETTAAERLNAGCFDVYFADPRDTPPPGNTPPTCRGHIRGTFSFFFERGRPSQPFP
jgi:hypothetical protein